MNFVTACIDGSAMTGSICDCAAWASQRLNLPLRLLHVLERTVIPAREDLSGAIGLGSREHLLDELTALDEERARLAIEHGRLMLEDARARCEKQGVTEIETRQRHGSLLEAVGECAEDSRVLVLGRLGEDHGVEQSTIGNQLENVVRASHVPILIAVGTFSPPTSYMVAYDGSKTADNAIARVSNSPLLADLPGHLVMVGNEDERQRNQLASACGLLESKGHSVTTHLMQGDVVSTLDAFQKQNQVDLKVMGAYGHSRIREFFLGSNTTRMISRSSIPLLLLR